MTNAVQKVYAEQSLGWYTCVFLKAVSLHDECSLMQNIKFLSLLC